MSVGATTVLNPERPTPALMFELMNKYQPDIVLRRADAVSPRCSTTRRCKEPSAPATLRICISAGEALPEQSVGNAWKARFGVDILDGVGSTELLHIFLSNAPGDIVYGTSGRPVPGYEVRLVDEDGADVARRRGRRTAGAMRPPPARATGTSASKSRQTFEGDWTRTGDKYTRDAEGRYTYCGRTDDMFKVSGIWVSPFEVESALITHPAVLEAAVVPRADRGRAAEAEGLRRAAADASTDGLDEALKEHVKQKIGPWKYPRWIEIVDSLPKTATGKIQRFKLRDGRLASRRPGDAGPSARLCLARPARGRGVCPGTSPGHTDATLN